MRIRYVRAATLLLGVAAFSTALLWPHVADAQTAFIPYYGKNRVRYTSFDWHIYKTDHFDIFFYPELEEHLERVASYAESAYTRLSGELKYEIATRIPLILFKTQSEFQTQNITGYELPEGVLAFAEPERRRMVLPIDEPPDQLYRLITHELTHIFEFEIIPRGLMASALPLWVDEGLANYMAGYWNVLDLMQVRDAALTDNVPRMSRFEAAPLTGRLPYSMGHAAFEFIESRWGKEGLREFLFELRKNIIAPGESAYESAFGMEPEEFDEEFDRYIKERFRAYRDKQRPADFGRDLAPSPERTKYTSVLSIEPAPVGEMIAAVVGNSRDFELDIVLLSARDGQDIRNLTKGFDKDRGFEYIASSGGLRGNLVPWISWDPSGDRIAYFVRTEKQKTLIVQDIVTGETVYRIELETIDAPESPTFSADGRRVAFSGLRNAVADIYTVDLATGAVTNLTADPYADYSPTYSPDGRSLVYTARISGNDKLFMLDLASGDKRQITFGTHDDTAARFINERRLIFTSTASDPNEPMLPSVEANGRIPNVWSLDLETGELEQWTDVAAGLVSPVVVRPSEKPEDMRIGFVSYNKGVNGIHLIEPPEQPVATVASADFGEPGPIIDFIPPQNHAVVPDNIQPKGRFERMTLAARPNVGVGLTSGGDFYGNTQVTFTDVLGDKSVSFYAQSYAQYRTTALTYVSIENRLQYALQGFSQEQFYYGLSSNLFAVAAFLDRDQAEASRTERGFTGFGIYPFNRYNRMEVSGGYVHLDENYRNADLQAQAEQQQIDRFGTRIFREGHMMPLGAAFIQETTIFREYGPVAGNTVKVGFQYSPGFSDGWLDSRTLDLDARHYTRLGTNGVFAVRFRGQQSWGKDPDFMFFGGNSEMRGYEYLEFLGHKAFFANAELRFPLIEAMLTPVGVLGGLRGVFFFNVGGAGFNNESFTFMSSDPEEYEPIVGVELDPGSGQFVPVLGDPVTIDGFRLVDSRASYGLGLESFILGFPMHFDWSWKTLFNRDWEDALFSLNGGSSEFRKVKFTFWIGYDF